MSAGLTPSWRVAVAYSGGRDSTALLHATARMAKALGGIEVVALHVHHGLSAHADGWLAHAEAQCAGWAEQGLPVFLLWRRLQLKVASGDSVEALARHGRYAALADMAREAGCDTVLLGHHRRDQAETFLLQALRGAGVAGLAAMPGSAFREGIAWLRPWLHHPRSVIEAYVAAHGLSHVDDDSNGDARHARNRLRLDVWPALTQAFGQTEGALAQAAARQADVLACLEDWLVEKLPLVTRSVPRPSSDAFEDPSGGTAKRTADTHARAHVDAHADVLGNALCVAAWLQWPPALQRELLRAWFRQTTGHGLPASWVVRLQDELDGVGARRWPLTLRRDGGVSCEGELMLYRGLLKWRPGIVSAGRGRPDVPQNWPLTVNAAGRWPLPDGLGTLIVTPAPEDECGLPLASLANAELRLRRGQERFQMALGRPARSLKKQFQMLGVPAFARDGPLLWSGDELLFVPGLGVNAPARADAPGPGQITLVWEPKAAQDGIEVTE